MASAGALRPQHGAVPSGGPALRPLLRGAFPEKPACSGHGCPSTHFLLRLPSQVKSVARPGHPLRPPPPAAPSGCVRSAQDGAWHTGPSRHIPPATRKYNRRTGRRRNPCGPWWRVKWGGPQPHLRDLPQRSESGDSAITASVFTTAGWEHPASADRRRTSTVWSVQTAPRPWGEGNGHLPQHA